MKKKWYEDVKQVSIITEKKSDETFHKPLPFLQTVMPIHAEHPVLGLGFNIFNGKYLERAIKAEKFSDEALGQSKSFYMKLIKDQSELKEEMEIGATASYSGLFNASAKTKFSTQTKLKRENVYFLVKVIVENKKTELKHYEPTKDFLAFIPEQNIDWERFIDIYGTEFISSVTYGGEFYALFEFHTNSMEKKFELEAHLEAKGWGAMVSAEFKKEIDALDISSEVTCTLCINGGEESLPDTIPEEIIKRALNFPKEVNSLTHAGILLRVESKDYNVIVKFKGYPSNIKAAIRNSKETYDKILEYLKKIDIREEIMKKEDIEDPKLLEVKKELENKINDIALTPLTSHQLPIDLFRYVDSKEQDKNINWIKEPALLKQISVGSKEYVWGVSSNGDIYNWSNEKAVFEKVYGNASQVAVGADGSAFHINLTHVFKWKAPKWETFSSLPVLPFVLLQGLLNLSVGNAEQIWVIIGNNVYQWNYKWQNRPLPPKIIPKEISAGPDGTVILISTDNQVFLWDSDKLSFEKMEGELTHVSVGNSTQVLGINNQGQVVKWDDCAWVPLKMIRKFTTVSIGDDGATWGLDGNGNVFRNSGLLEKSTPITGKKELAI